MEQNTEVAEAANLKAEKDYVSLLMLYQRILGEYLPKAKARGIDVSAWEGQKQYPDIDSVLGEAPYPAAYTKLRHLHARLEAAKGILADASIKLYVTMKSEEREKERMSRPAERSMTRCRACDGSGRVWVLTFCFPHTMRCDGGCGGSGWFYTD